LPTLNLNNKEIINKNKSYSRIKVNFYKVMRYLKLELFLLYMIYAIK